MLQVVGPIHRIEGIMDQYKYIDILNEVLLPFTRNQMPDNWGFCKLTKTRNTQPVGLNNFYVSKM
ncbi:hypothetical protein WH47_07552 [Habropoda laboriosa]|uniref:Uncharacterized protein n=1 Tax=Habropoda laboriosa TaxID=597456 RepID=A0A0L7QIX1_9HYME|nr:hypothetical protein WH47_07552 [Habropoda laboriosa]